jgi:hypothetical protein
MGAASFPAGRDYTGGQILGHKTTRIKTLMYERQANPGAVSIDETFGWIVA